MPIGADSPVICPGHARATGRTCAAQVTALGADVPAKDGLACLPTGIVGALQD